MLKLKSYLLSIVFIGFIAVNSADAQDCTVWYSAVGVKGVAAKAGEMDKKIEKITTAIECLLLLEGDKSRGAFSGATHLGMVGEEFPPSTVEICALYYISFLFYEKYDHGNAVALRYRDYATKRELNSDEAISIAYKSYRKWFEKVKEMGLDKARKQKLDPLDGTDVRWF